MIAQVLLTVSGSICWRAFSGLMVSHMDPTPCVQPCDCALHACKTEVIFFSSSLNLVSSYDMYLMRLIISLSIPQSVVFTSVLSLKTYLFLEFTDMALHLACV